MLLFRESGEKQENEKKANKNKMKVSLQVFEAILLVELIIHISIWCPIKSPCLLQSRTSYVELKQLSSAQDFKLSWSWIQLSMERSHLPLKEATSGFNSYPPLLALHVYFREPSCFYEHQVTGMTTLISPQWTNQLNIFICVLALYEAFKFYKVTTSLLRGTVVLYETMFV